MGIDPARRPAETARTNGIPTLTEFFTSDLAQAIGREHGRAAFVTANNVFAHAEGLRDMAVGVRELLAPDGLFVYDEAPQFRVGCALKICRPLMNKTVRLSTLIQCIRRTGRRCR